MFLTSHISASMGIYNATAKPTNSKAGRRLNATSALGSQEFQPAVYSSEIAPSRRTILSGSEGDGVDIVLIIVGRGPPIQRNSALEHPGPSAL